MHIHQERLKKLMERSGIKTQAELARRCGINRVSLNRLIRHHRGGINSSTIDSLCGVLNAQPGDFLYYTPDPLQES